MRYRWIAAIACSLVVACVAPAAPLPTAPLPTVGTTTRPDVTPSPEIAQDGSTRFEVTYFSAPAPGLPAVSSYMTTIDFNHDGRPDIVIAWDYRRGGGFLQALRNDGAGRFVDATAQVFNAAENSIELARNFAVADFNGDGLPDLAIADSGLDDPPFPGAQSRLFIGTASGQLVDETASRLPQTKAFTHDICAGDVDGDGHADLYLSNLASQAGTGPGLYLNDGVGHFTATAGRLPVSVAQGAVVYTACRFVDVDRDGDVDLLLGPIHNANVSRETLLLNDGRGHLTPAGPDAMPLRTAPNDSTIYIDAADLSGDGWPDLLLTTYDSAFTNGKVHVLINKGNGSFADRTDLVVKQPLSASWFVAARAFPRGPGSNPGFVMGPPPSLFLPTSATFGAAAFHAFGGALPSWGDVLPLDVDSDGRTDLFVTTAYGEFAVARNLGP
jgi:hypothetical protein